MPEVVPAPKVVPPPPPPETTAASALAQERPSAIRPKHQREVKHGPKPGTDRATKEAIGAKIEDRLKQVADEGVTDTQKKRLSSHFSPGKKRVAPDPVAEADDTAGGTTTEQPLVAQTDATEKKPSEAPTSDTPQTEAAPAESTLVLPDAHRRSLKNFGWEDADIDASMKGAGAAAFLTTAAKIHAQRSKEIQAYARAGQALQGTTQPVPTPAPAPTAPPQGSMVDRVMQKNAALKKAYPGNDALFDSMITSELDMAKLLDSQREAQQAAQLDLQTKQVDAFFSAEHLKVYKAHYGESFAAADAEQSKRRDQVINTAAYIVRGARAQGVELDLNTALQMAHDATAAPIAKQAARQEIINEVQARANGLTQKNQAGPSTKREGAGKGPPSRSELLRKTGDRLKAAGLR
jgi:hypothetical protein